MDPGLAPWPAASLESCCLIRVRGQRSGQACSVVRKQSVWWIQYESQLLSALTHTHTHTALPIVVYSIMWYYFNALNSAVACGLRRSRCSSLIWRCSCWFNEKSGCWVGSSSCSFCLLTLLECESRHDCMHSSVHLKCMYIYIYLFSFQGCDDHSFPKTLESVKMAIMSRKNELQSVAGLRSHWDAHVYTVMQCALNIGENMQ